MTTSPAMSLPPTTSSALLLAWMSSAIGFVSALRMSSVRQKVSGWHQLAANGSREPYIAPAILMDGPLRRPYPPLTARHIRLYKV